MVGEHAMNVDNCVVVFGLVASVVALKSTTLQLHPPQAYFRLTSSTTFATHTSTAIKLYFSPWSSYRAAAPLPLPQRRCLSALQYALVR